MEWRREDVVSLIKLYREQRVLWDASHPDFRVRPRKHEAWMEIATIMNTPKAEVESKMRKLSGQFYREEKRCNSGAGESKWFAYKILLFLRDKQQIRSTDAATGSADDTYHSNLSGCNLDHFREDEDSEGEAYEYDLQGHEAQLSRDTSIASEIEVDPVSRENRKRKTELPLPPQNLTKRIMKPSVGVDEEDFMTWSNYRDEFDVFGENVAFTIRKLKSRLAKIIVKHEINNILFKAEMGKFDSARDQLLPAETPAAPSGSPTPASPPKNLILN